MRSDYEVREAEWHRRLDREALEAIRRAVFIEEQQVPEELEWEQEDEVSIHLLARDADGRAIGCARILPDGHIGRVAVVREWRGRGVGTALMKAALARAWRNGVAVAEISAQCHALAFYARLGFQPYGPEFLDAAIPHRRMRCILDKGDGGRAK